MSGLYIPTKALAVLLLVLFSLATSLPCRAFNLESMLSPGELSQPHHKYEKDCGRCHDRSNRRQGNDLCLDCHENVGTDIQSKQGYHGRHPGISQSECRLCHSEHNGLKADILQLNRNSFPHQNTDFPLLGKHQSLSCEQCHLAGKKFHEAPGDCHSCHQKEDVHKGSQGQDCSNCHVSDSWSQTRFDHNQTRFPLRGGHNEAQCSQCHRTADYKQTPSTCHSCHQIDDRHQGTLGQQCDNCHTEKAWSSSRFNHRQDTGFDLSGAHAPLNCLACHKTSVTGPHPAPVAKTCNGCHKPDDVHMGQNGSQCESCHNTERWSKSRFDHSKTDFALAGSHQGLRCSACHQDDVKKPIPDTRCVACHQKDDKHDKALGTQCEACHGNRHWGDDLRFDHDLTPFPLLGGHARVACEACHSDSQFRNAPQTCIQCHQDDAHQGTLGNNCGQCHHPVSWQSWNFDHDQQSHFPLQGAHQALQCAACHNANLDRIKGRGQACGNCHQSDDVHQGAYGQQCDQCHGVDQFSTLNMR